MNQVLELLKWFAAYQANLSRPRYDWNADPERITLKTSQAIAFMEKETGHQAVEWGED